MDPAIPRQIEGLEKIRMLQVLQPSDKKKIRMLIKDQVGVGTRTVTKSSTSHLNSSVKDKKVSRIIVKFTSGASRGDNMPI